MTRSLFFSAITKFILGIVCTALLLFLPAGTLRYPNGWLFFTLLFVPMLVAGFVLMFTNPDLLKRRLKAKEPQPTQRRLIALSALVFVLGFVLAGLCFRFQRFLVPKQISYIAGAVFLLGYVLYGVVIAYNRWLARTIEIQPEQQLVDRGPYSVVRHPMYTAVLLMFLPIALILGSWLAIFPFLAFPAILAGRIANEEQLLTDGLAGYADYKTRVKYRLIPFVW